MARSGDSPSPIQQRRGWAPTEVGGWGEKADPVSWCYEWVRGTANGLLLALEREARHQAGGPGRPIN